MFKAMFRMSRRQYELLRASIGERLHADLSAAQVEARQSETSSLRPVTVDETICIALRLLAGATYVDAVWGFAVGKSSVYNILKRFMKAVIVSNVGPINFPRSQSELQRLADLMDKIGVKRPEYHGCIGALDGYVVRIRQPNAKEVAAPLTYRCRKGFCAINMQAICDGHLRFLSVTMETPGSTYCLSYDILC